MSLTSDKWNCITGASSGLGLALAEDFALEKTRLILISRSSSAELNHSEILNKAKSEGRLMHFMCDVSKHDEVKDAFSAINTELKVLQNVIHCAGIYGPFGSIQDVNFAEWQDAININLNGTFNVLKYSVIQFKQQGNFGNFIGLSGGGATSPMPRILSYAASKSAALRLIESVALDNANSDMTFNSIAPGIMKTKMLDAVLSGSADDVGQEFFEKMSLASVNDIDSKEIAISLIKEICNGTMQNVNGRLISAVWDDWKNLNPERLLNDENYLRTRRIL